jgi:hypothetical protein
MQAAKASSFLWAGNVLLPRQEVTQIQHVDLFARAHLEHGAQHATFSEGRKKRANQGVSMRRVATLVVALVCTTARAQTNTQTNNGCSSLPGYSALHSALATATATETSGLNNHGVQLIEQRRRIAADQEAEETEHGHNPWDDLIEPRVKKLGLEHAQCKDKGANACGHQYRPIETRRDVGDPGLRLNRASIFPFVGGHDARGLAAAQNAA